MMNVPLYRVSNITSADYSEETGTEDSAKSNWIAASGNIW